MNKFFNYYNSNCLGSNSPNIFSYDPYIAAVKEMLLYELQQLVYYIEKLKELDVDMAEYTDKVIDFISLIIINLDFNKESFFIIIEDLYNNKKILEKMYISACEKNSLNPILLNEDNTDYSSKESVLKVLNEYEKNVQNSKNQLDNEKRALYEIIISLVLNSCNCLIQLKHFGENSETAKNQVLKLLNTSNIPSLSKNEWIEKIEEFSKCNYKIVKLLYDTIINKYGPSIEKRVELFEKKGKSILVSGNNLLDLEKILAAVKGLNINVYTHQDMLSAHQYKKFTQYPNLIGHYQNISGNFTLDFASFPGPIYISGNSIPKIDVIRGQIYTSNKYPAYGIGKINNEDFSTLIKYALDSKGFDSDNFVDKVDIGYSQEEINDYLSDIFNKFNSQKIKHIFVIGLIDRFSQKNNYVHNFIDLCPENSYIISFCYDSDRQNFWHANSYLDFSELYKIIELINDREPEILNNLSVFILDCNTSTIAHIFNLLYLKVDEIFLGTCCPNIINPVLSEGLNKIFNIQAITKPFDDINFCIK